MKKYRLLTVRKFLTAFTALMRQEMEKKVTYGLGLAIAKGIVTEQGGSIHVECENGWVTFVVKL